DDGGRVSGRSPGGASRHHTVPTRVRRIDGGSTWIGGVIRWLVRLKPDTTNTVAGAIFVLFFASPSAAQINGHVSVMFDTLPELEAAPGSHSSSDLRMRLFVERHDEFGSHLRINLAGYVDGLLADRDFRLKAEATNAPNSDAGGFPLHAGG